MASMPGWNASKRFRATSLDGKLNVKERRFFPVLLDADHCGEPWPWMALTLGGPSLANRLGSGKLSPDMVSVVANQLQSALRILHQRASLLHLDVKPSNCPWLEEIQLLRLCDVGMAEVQVSVSAQHQALGLKGHHGKVVEQPRLQAYVTALGRPPEFFNLQNAQLCTLRRLLSPAVDMWSYGCVVYEAAAGKPFMKLTKPVNASAQRGVAEWCQHYKQMCGKGYQKMLRNKFKTCFPARLSVHGRWAEVILNACAPQALEAGSSEQCLKGVWSMVHRSMVRIGPWSSVFLAQSRQTSQRNAVQGRKKEWAAWSVVASDS